MQMFNKAGVEISASAVYSIQVQRYGIIACSSSLHCAPSDSTPLGDPQCTRHKDVFIYHYQIIDNIKFYRPSSRFAEATERAEFVKLIVLLAYFSRSHLLDSRWGGKHEATRRVIPGSERIKDLKPDPICNCNNVAVDRILNHFGALAFVTHLSAVVVSAEESDQPPGQRTEKNGGREHGGRSI